MRKAARESKVITQVGNQGHSSDSIRLFVEMVQSGVIGNIRSCDGAWCLIDGEGFKGYIKQANLWGVYPGDKVE